MTVPGRLALAIATLILIRTKSQDTTPPTIHIDYVRPYIFHILLTVQLSEEGTVYCGAVQNSGGGTTAPSNYQMATGSGLAGHGQASAVANEFTQVLVTGLSHTTIYDLYCLGVDANLNEMNYAGITATRRAMIVTASGGDYVPPTFAYRSPYEQIESVEALVFVGLSEDGVVYCVALKDSGIGTEAPTGTLIKNGQGVYASWGSASITAANGFQMFVRLEGLEEDTPYDIYCFGEDMSGNGIDHTPAYPVQQSFINATKRSVRTLELFISSRFFVNIGTGKVRYHVEPASWNIDLPRSWGEGCTERRNIESWNTFTAFTGVMLTDHTNEPALGCDGLPSVPRGGSSWMVIVRRGRCTFAQKTIMAGIAGFVGIFVIDYPNVVLTDMTATDNAVAEVKVPAWLISSELGNIVATQIASTPPGLLSFDVSDVRRKPKLGWDQMDTFGLRRYATM